MALTLKSSQNRLLRLFLLWKIYRKKRRTHKYWVQPLLEARSTKGSYNILVKELQLGNDVNFWLYFRMTKAQFAKLLSMVEMAIVKKNTKFREAISPEERLSVTIRYLASGESIRSLWFQYRLGHATIRNIIKETCEVIWLNLHDTYMPAPNESHWRNIAEKFFVLWNFPLCLGAIDGKHIQIQCPVNSGSDYFNYKGYFSTVLLAVVDAQYKFVIIDVGGYGRESDGGLFNQSVFGDMLQKGQLDLPKGHNINGLKLDQPYTFVADAAFPLRGNIMRPYPGDYLPETQYIFNTRLTRARKLVENGFGILAVKWRIFRRPIDLKIETIDFVVKAACLLHNFVIMESKESGNSNYVQEGLQEAKKESGFPSVMQLDQTTPCLVAKRVREEFLRYFNSDIGKIDFNISV